ncbi:MAG: hypothetical protein PVJ34_19770 [Anaerolineae bacterium]|jgi:hypothetical protein
MLDVLRVIRYSLKDLWDEFVLLIMLNLFWTFAAALPLAPFFFLPTSASLILILGLTLLLLLPLPIVSAGICFVTNQITRGRAVDLGTFARGARRYWLKALAVAGINLVVLVLIASNLQFYAVVLEGAWTNIALAIWLVVGLYWLVAQLYWFPMLLELEEEKVLIALRNALVLIVVAPVFSLALALFVLILALACILLTVPAVLVMACLLLLVVNHATRSRLAAARKEPYRPGAPKA